MSRTSRAMVFTGAGNPLELREYALPRLKCGELLVEVTCCTLCGSDLHTYQGRRAVACPSVLGHEILGRVAELPQDAAVLDYLGRPLNIGDRVTWSIMASCGNCFFCRRGIPQKCDRLFKYGHEEVVPEHPLSGGLADYCHLAAGTTVLRVPDALPDHVACSANCATATAAAALRAAGEYRDRTVLVQGAGMLGLTAAAMARHGGAREVIVCDVQGARLAQAARFGATQTVTLDGDTRALAQIVEDSSEGRGVDIALEMCGAPAAFEQALPLLVTGGRYVVVGAVFSSRPVTLSAEMIVRNLLAIHGVHNYTPEDLAAALEFLADARTTFPFAELVSAPFPLLQADAAFEHAASGRSWRVAVGR